MKQVKKRQRKNRRIKYNEEVYIEKNYIVDGKAVIPVELEKTDDLFMKHDFKKYELSDEVCDYIEEIAYMIPMNTDIVIKLHCPKVDDEMQIKMIKAIKNNYGMDIDDIDYDIRMHNYKSIILFLIGAFLIFLSFIFANLSFGLSGFIAEFFMISGWVFIWDMVETISLTRSELISKRINKLQLYDAEITFIFDD